MYIHIYIYKSAIHTHTHTRMHILIWMPNEVGHLMKENSNPGWTNILNDNL